MIDLNDENIKYFYLGKCVSRQPINFYTEKIYHPIVNDIFEMGENEYFKLLTPFIIPIEYFKNVPSDVTVYEAIMQDRDMCISLIQSLIYFLKLKIENDEGEMDIKIYNIEDKQKGRSKNQLITKSGLIIDDEKFNELKTLILLMCNTKELTKEDLGIKDKNPISEKKERLLKLRKESRTGKLEEKRVKLVNVYDYLVHKPDIPNYDMYLSWSIYQLYNTYTNSIKKEHVQFTYDVITNGMGTKEMKLESLAEKIIK